MLKLSITKLAFFFIENLLPLIKVKSNKLYLTSFKLSSMTNICSWYVSDNRIISVFNITAYLPSQYLNGKHSCITQPKVLLLLLTIHNFLLCTVSQMYLYINGLAEGWKGKFVTGYLTWLSGGQVMVISGMYAFNVGVLLKLLDILSATSRIN